MRDDFYANRAYLAGPMRGLPKYNFPAFMEAAYEMRCRGWDIWNPAERDLSLGFNPDLPLEDQKFFSLAEAMAEDLSVILEYKTVILLPGWSDSKGATLEREVCLAVGGEALELKDLLFGDPLI